MTSERCSGIERHPSVHSTPSGIILYHGPSQLDREPIVAIATGLTRPTLNVKTGPMIQTWILHATTAPHEAAKNGQDYSVCGDCQLRSQSPSGSERSCYVIPHQAPLRVWRSWKDDSYRPVEDAGWKWLHNRAVRFGSYGDPAAVPARVWLSLASHAVSWTGYTHQWHREDFQALRWLLMASVDTPDEAWKAWRLGWRTYRTRLPGEELLPYESVCPASPEGGYKTNCIGCGQCDGARLRDLRRSYAIVAHGTGEKAYRKLRLPILP